MPADTAMATQNPLVYVNGLELTQAQLDSLVELRIEMELRLPGRVTLRFQDPDGSHALDSRFGLGNKIQIKPIGATTSIIDAEITGLSFEASTSTLPKPRSGGRTNTVDEFVVTAHDQAHRLTRASTVAGLTDLTSSEIVQRLASSYNVTSDVTSTATRFHGLLQVHNDYELMNALADREGYDWWFGPGNKLSFQPPGTSGATVVLELGTETLESFSVSATGLRPDKVSVRGWDSDQQQALVGAANVSDSAVWPKDVKLLSGFKNAGSRFGGDKELVTGQFAPLTDDSESIARGLAARIAAGSVVARGIGEGNHKIALGCSVEIRGSKPVNGTYHVTKVQHIVRRDSYKTRFVAGDRTPTSLADVVATPTSPQFPMRHQGVVTAVVSSLAPANAGKDKNMLRVAFKGIDDKLESTWARFLAVGAGGTNGRGLVMLPEVGDEVLVAFENGDIHKPVVLGGLYSAKNPVSTWDVESGKVMSRRFISRQGHLIEIKDGDKDAERYVKIEVQRADKENASLLLAGDKVELKTPPQEPITITSGATKIEIADNGDVTVDAPNITLKGKEKITLQALTIEVKAQTGLTLDGGTQTDLKGTMVQAEAQGPMTIKGALVKVN